MKMKTLVNTLVSEVIPNDVLVQNSINSFPETERENIRSLVESVYKKAYIRGLKQLITDPYFEDIEEVRERLRNVVLSAKKKKNFIS